MSVGTIILIILVIVLLGGFSGLGGAPFYGTGYYGGGGLGLVIVILSMGNFASTALPNHRSNFANCSARARPRGLADNALHN